MSATTIVSPAHPREEPCLDIYEFQRLNYFFGQLLGSCDFELEQKYFREKLKLHNRCLHGYGTLCGLLVEPVPIPFECPSEEQERKSKLEEELESLRAERETAGQGTRELDARIEEILRELGEFYKVHCGGHPHTMIRITPGLALDCHGNEIVVRHAKPVDLVQYLSPQDQARVKQGARSLYVSICYCEEPGGMARAVLPDICGSAPACNYTRIHECFEIKVTLDAPKRDCRCETCCTCCKECCLLLARIDHFDPGLPIHDRNIHNVRPQVRAGYQPTVITGVSWKNGHEYTQEQARHLMGTRDHGNHHGGLKIHFSRPVHASTINRGVMDTWVVEGGGGRAGNIYNKPGEFVGKPDHGLVDHIVYRDVSRETLEPGDRVIVMLRTEFILDECCHPVDGFNVGGRVPVLKKSAEQFHTYDDFRDCAIPPCGYGPWTTGMGAASGGFQSWFFIREDD